MVGGPRWMLLFGPAALLKTLFLMLLYAHTHIHGHTHVPAWFLQSMAMAVGVIPEQLRTTAGQERMLVFFSHVP